jgi:hypothetical protein
LGYFQEQQQRFVHTVARQPVKRFCNKHRARRNFAVFDALNKTAEFTRLRIVAAKSRDADVLQGLGNRQSVGFDEPQRGVVLPPFAVAPGLRLRRESDVDIRQ